MTREQFERFVEAVENLVRSDLVEIAGMWRQDIDRLKAFRKIEKRKRRRARRHLSARAAPDKAAWTYPDPRLLLHLPSDLALGFVKAAKSVLSGEESPGRAFGLLRRRGRPFDPATSGNLDTAEEAFRLKYECRLSWKRVVNQINEKRKQPIDERTIRRMIDSHLPAIYRRRAKALAGRLLKFHR
jgi:hypothetical protein